MKKLMVAVQVILLLLVVAEVRATGKTKKKGVVDIVDVRKTKLPGDDLKRHKYHDVVVYRTISENFGEKNDGYEVYYYSNFDDTLFCYKAGLPQTTGDYIKATYKWENDTLADINLYKKGHKGKKSCKVFGVGRKGIKTEGVITETP